MAIITIARELGAWGENARQLLAKRLNATLIDKNVIESRLDHHGLDEKLLQRYDERKPGFFSSFSADQDIYLLFLKTVMLEAADHGPAIILGRGGNVLMGDLPNCVRIRLVAPPQVRIARICHEYECDEATATKLMRKCDEDRAGFCHFHFNAAWADASQYDLTINTGKLSDEQLVDLIASIAAHVTPEAESKTARIVKNRLLAQRVVKHIFLTRKLSLAFLEVTADDNGKVTLQGATSTPGVARQAGDAAREVEGVTDVDNHIQVAIELSHGHL